VAAIGRGRHASTLRRPAPASAGADPGGLTARARTRRDTAHKASLAETPRARQRAAIDTLAWQTLASVVLPGFTINRVVFAARFAAERAGPRAPAALARWGPVGLGLATIPLIVKPIDEAVHVFMGATVRKWEP